MSENEYNPRDPVFLASRSIDEPLDEQDTERLTTGDGDSERVRGELEAFRAVDGLVKQWGADRVNVDADRYTHSVLARLLDETDEAVDEVDRIVGQWALSAPNVAEDQYVDAVLARIKTRQARVSLRPLVFRIGLPLAAAAAIALALTVGLWFGDERAVDAPVSIVTYASQEQPSEMGMAMAAEPGTSRTVVFDRTVVASAVRQDNGQSVSFIVVGSAPIESDLADLPPL